MKRHDPAAPTVSGYCPAKIPEPRVRLFDVCRRKRKVVLTVLKYWGIGVHWHLSIKEEDNPVWVDPYRGMEEGAWYYDDACGGREYGDRRHEDDVEEGEQRGVTHDGGCIRRTFLDQGELEAAAQQFIEQNFPQATHEVERRGEPHPTWHYKDGD